MHARKAVGIQFAVVLAAAFTTSEIRADIEHDVKVVFREFIAAQNAHDLRTVSGILRNSPETLWITRGTAIFGSDAILARFQEYYRGTWQIEPQLEKLKVNKLSDNVAQVFVPVMISIAPPNRAAQWRRFLLTQIYVKTVSTWQLTTIETIPSASTTPPDPPQPRPQ